MPSENPPERKLAVILFADIAGYTAMMQSDECKTMNRLRHYQQILSEKAKEHKGEIVKNYGDGSLCLFTSVLGAVKCAKDLQIIFQTEPKVPLRIGLHIGDVMYESNDIYGNAINVASRIESMGIPGSVLMSWDVYKKVRNQSSLKFKELGSFDFKNVEEPMSVFALANEGFVVPKQSEMKGKGKLTANGKNRWLLPSIIGILLIATLGFWQVYSTDNSLELNQSNISPTGTPIPPSVLEQRVAIIPIQNNTNNPELDIMGKMAADWINRGLMEIETAEVVSPYTVNQHLDAIGILPINAQNKPSFSELTGARNFIQGSFYEEKGELIFLMELVDAIDGKIKFKFPDIRGAANEKEALITQLRESIAGYWATRNMVDTKQIKAPKYKAYASYLERLEQGIYDDNPLEAIALDSTFYLARIHFLSTNRGGRSGDNKIHLDFFDRHARHLSEYEKGWVSFLDNLYQGNSLAAFNSLNANRKKYPNDFRLNHECASAAEQLLKNPKLSLAIFEELPLDNISPKKVGEMYNWRLVNQAYGYLLTNQPAKSELFLKTYPPNTDADLCFYQLAKLRDANIRNDGIEIAKSKKEFLAAPNVLFISIMTSLHSRIFLSDELEEEINNDLIALYQQEKKKPNVELFLSNYFAFVMHQPENINLENLDQLPKMVHIYQLFYAGLAYLDAGQNQQLEYIINELEKLTAIEYKVIARVGGGMAYYTLGILHTQMGQYDQALKELQQAKKYGAVGGFQHDNRLSPLFEMPGFQELVKPIWPDLRD